STDRPFSQELLKTHKIYHRLSNIDRIDTAIAFKKNLFSGVKSICIQSNSHPDNQMLYGQEIAAIVCTLKIKKDVEAKIMFGSMHNWGFHLYPSNHSQQKHYTKNDRDQTGYGRVYAQESIDLAQQQIQEQGVQCVVLGGDMNNNRHNDDFPFQNFEQQGF